LNDFCRIKLREAHRAEEGDAAKQKAEAQPLSIRVEPSIP
jgi:hypothetical protein